MPLVGNKRNCKIRVFFVYVKQFKLIFISHENYGDFTQPWHPDLNKYITEVWNFEATATDGAKLKIAQLYEVNID